MTGGLRPRFSSSASFNYHGRAYAAVVAPRYHYYHDFGYRPFFVHDRFPAFLLINTNFIESYYLYNLAPPPPGAVWVRFGPDAVLVNSFTGDIIDTAPSLFADGDTGAPGGDPDAGPPPDGPGADAPAPPAPYSDGAPYPGPNGFLPPPDQGPGAN